MAHIRDLEEVSLLSICREAAREGQKILDIFPAEGGTSVALWGEDGKIVERDAGPGPHERPSRCGFPSLRFSEERDFPPDAFEPAAAPRAIIGEGMHVIPLGPVRADVAEALRYEMDVLGDEIHSLTLRPGYKRRGVTRILQGMEPSQAVEVAERTSGTSTVAHALAFSLAVEHALGLEVDDSTAVLRSTLAELERLHSHLGDLASLAAATGTIVAAADLYRLRDSVLRFGERWTGHRYLRGLIAPVGWRRTLPDVSAELPSLLGTVEHQFQVVRHALDHTNSFLDRLHGAGRIPQEGLELVGVVGRSAGRSEDVRWDRPYASYPELCYGRLPAGFAAGDAYGRYVVRCEEIAQSVAMLRRAGGHAAAATPAAERGDGLGYGLVEAPRGRLFYRVALRGGRIAASRIRTASSINWIAVPLAVANRNILQDFPIIDASFNLSVASLDL